MKGFKSFASATTLRFEPGITCVVGPNGSGKSNVVDALTWVMGEQGAKALRGGKMQDVIFAGTSGRQALGRAEVTLTIDNSDGMLPIEYSEVSITRRMFRDGAGEYEINGNSCRLMDVQELLSDSGIGREMHVIVGQGQLAAILQSRPEERRAFIEEAAGVLKHRKRKEKAVRKLDSMQANLARLTDLTTELRRQLKPLGRQAEVARRAATVQADLRDARLRLVADDLVTRQKELADQQSREAYAREQQITVQTELDAAAAAVAEGKFALSRLTPSAEAAGQLWFQVSAAAERVAATVRIAKERARHLDTPVPVGSGRDPEDLEAEAERAALEEAELAEAREVAAEAAEQAREQVGITEQAAQAAEQAHMAALREVADRREGLARLAGQAETLRSRVQSVDAELARVAEAAEQARVRGTEAQADYDAAKEELAELQAAKADVDLAHENATRAAATAKERLSELRTQDRQAGKQVASLAARLEAWRANAAASRDGAAWLLENHSEGISGKISEQLRVRSGYEAAVAAVLGSIADGVLAESRGAARRALDALRSGEGGRAAVVFAGEDVPKGQSQPDLPDGAEWLLPLTDPTEPVRAAVAALLGRIVVVDDPATAEAVLAGDPHAQVVTRDGELLGVGWWIGGTRRARSPLEVRADIATAENELASAQCQAAEVEAALAEATAEYDRCRSEVEQTALAVHDSNRALREVRDRLARFRKAVDHATAEYEKTHTAGRKAEENRQQLIQELTDTETRLGAVGIDTGVDETAAASLENASLERETAAAALASARAVEMEARLTARSAAERAERVAGRAESLRRAAQAEREARRRAAEARAGREHAATLAHTVAEQGARIAQHLDELVSAAAARRDSLVARRGECAAQVEQLDSRVGTLNTELAKLTDTLHRDEVARAEAALRIEQVQAQIAEQFGIAVEDLVGEYGPDVPMPPSALEWQEYEQALERGEQVAEPAALPFDRATQLRRVRQAERDLSTLGKVNPLALEEFAALEERYTFLATQLDDIKKARKNLLDVVAEVDARIEQTFTEAYADVAREFVDVFATLFPGGEGRLLLTEPSNMATTGVEVEARPPGKKVKRLSLLSGGEKSLTAVALLVAIFKARPSPFYVLDEVEAALDDTNLRRLIALFEQLREKSQLIVITHQKPTMEIADALYGVSMRGDGITQVISQRLRGQPSSDAGADAPHPQPTPIP